MQLIRAAVILAFLATPALADKLPAPPPPAKWTGPVAQPERTRPTPPPVPAAQTPAPGADTSRIAPAFVKHLLDELTEKDRLIALQAAQIDVLREDLAQVAKDKK
jgi:hypothetical protein